MVPVIAPTKPEGPQFKVGTNATDNRQMAASSTYTAPIPESTSLRYTPEVGAQCISSACWDLCGGCRVTGIPTATYNIQHSADDIFNCAGSVQQGMIAYGLFLFGGQQIPASGFCRVTGFKKTKHDFIDAHFRRADACPGFGEGQRVGRL